MKKFAIIGFGNQAKAWALNLRDSKFDFTILLRKGSSSVLKVKEMKFSFSYIEDALDTFSHFALLCPDETHELIVKDIYHRIQNPSFIYAHGFSVQKSKLNSSCPLASHLLLAPKSIASELRFDFELNKNIPGIYSFEYNKSFENEGFIKDLAHSLGVKCLKQATFEQETIADLFSEQTLLCSTLPYLANLSFEILIKNGTPKELAYMECFHELKSISAALIKLGPLRFFDMISPNALLGSDIGRNRILTKELNDAFIHIFQNIKNESFYSQMQHCNVDELRAQIKEFWAQSKLQDTFDELKEELS